MKLSVDFVGKENTSHMRTTLYEMKESPLGLKAVEKIRKETDVQNLDLSVIEHKRRGNVSSDFTAFVKEDFAKKSNLFDDNNTIVVRCPRYFFNQFIVEKVVVQKCDTTGEIKNAWITQELDCAKILQAWQDAGFPLEWGFYQPDTQSVCSTNKFGGKE